MARGDDKKKREAASPNIPSTPPSHPTARPSSSQKSPASAAAAMARGDQGEKKKREAASHGSPSTPPLSRSTARPSSSHKSPAPAAAARDDQDEREAASPDSPSTPTSPRPTARPSSSKSPAPAAAGAQGYTTPKARSQSGGKGSDNNEQGTPSTRTEYLDAIAKSSGFTSNFLFYDTTWEYKKLLAELKKHVLDIFKDLESCGHEIERFYIGSTARGSDNETLGWDFPQGNAATRWRGHSERREPNPATLFVAILDADTEMVEIFCGSTPIFPRLFATQMEHDLMRKFEDDRLVASDNGGGVGVLIANDIGIVYVVFTFAQETEESVESTKQKKVTKVKSLKGKKEEGNADKPKLMTIKRN